MYCRVCRVICTRLHDGSPFLVSLGGKHSNRFRFLEFLKWSVHPSWITAVWTLLSNPKILADFLWTCIRSFVIHPWLKFGAAATNDNDPQMFLPMNKVQNKIAVILFPLPPRSLDFSWEKGWPSPVFWWQTIYSGEPFSWMVSFVRRPIAWKVCFEENLLHNPFRMPLRSFKFIEHNLLACK